MSNAHASNRDVCIRSANSALRHAIDAAIQRGIDAGELTAWMWVRRHQYDLAYYHLTRFGYAVSAASIEDDPTGWWLEIDFTGQAAATPPAARYE